MKLSRLLLTMLTGAALGACDGTTVADVEAVPPTMATSPVPTQTATPPNTTPLHFEGEAQFWWEVAFATNPSCDDDVLHQEVDLRVKLGKLMGTAPVPEALLITSLNVETWELELVTSLPVDEQELRANDGDLRIAFDVDMAEKGLQCNSPANLLVVQAVGAAGYGRSLDDAGLASLPSFGCRTLAVGADAPLVECSTSCGGSGRQVGRSCDESFVPATIDVYFYDLKQGQLLSGLSTELEWTDEVAPDAVFAQHTWRGAAAPTSAHQLKVIIARDEDGEILSVRAI